MQLECIRSWAPDHPPPSVTGSLPPRVLPSPCGGLGGEPILPPPPPPHLDWLLAIVMAGLESGGDHPVTHAQLLVLPGRN